MKKQILFFVSLCLWFDLEAIQTLSASEIRHRSLYKEPITIGAVKWPGYLALYVADAKGFFKEAGLNVQIKHYAALADLSKDYTAGKVEARANLNFEAVNEFINGMDHKIVLAIDYSNGADGIIAGPAIQSVRDFKGKRVGYEYDTLEEFLLTWALEQSELQIADVVGVPANPEEALNMLKDGKVDVAVSYEPFISKLVSSGEFHVVYSSTDAPGLITDVLTFRTDFVETHPETIQAIIQAYFKAVDFWKEHPDETHAILAKVLDDTPDGVVEQLKGVKIFDARDNDVAFTFSTGLQSLYGNLRQVGKFVRQHGNSSLHPLGTDKLVERRFIKGFNEGG